MGAALGLGLYRWLGPGGPAAANTVHDRNVVALRFNRRLGVFGGLAVIAIILAAIGVLEPVRAAAWALLLAGIGLRAGFESA